MSKGSAVIEEILQQAIRFERDAYDFYIQAQDMVEQPHVKDTIRTLAAEEVKHQERLQDLLAGDTEAIIESRGRRQIADLKLAEYLVSPELEQDATFQDVLLVAMHREKSSHEFYVAMVGIADSQTAKDLFEFLANEELGHKNKIEKLYDDTVYQDF
jgi:rubrerythrin